MRFVVCRKQHIWLAHCTQSIPPGLGLMLRVPHRSPTTCPLCRDELRDFQWCAQLPSAFIQYRMGVDHRAPMANVCTCKPLFTFYNAQRTLAIGPVVHLSFYHLWMHCHMLCSKPIITLSLFLLPCICILTLSDILKSCRIFANALARLAPE